MRKVPRGKFASPAREKSCQPVADGQRGGQAFPGYRRFAHVDLSECKTGTVDGGDLPIDVIYSQKFHEVAKHIAMTGHFALTPPFFVSDKFMSKLSAEEKAAVYASADVAAIAARKQVAEKEASIIAKLKKDHGVKFTSPDTAPFIAAAAKVHAEFAKKRGGDYTKLIDAINGAAK